MIYGPMDLVRYIESNRCVVTSVRTKTTSIPAFVNFDSASSITFLATKLPTSPPKRMNSFNAASLNSDEPMMFCNTGKTLDAPQPCFTASSMNSDPPTRLSRTFATALASKFFSAFSGDAIALSNK